MILPPKCPICKSDKPTVNLVGPKGIPLRLPNVLAVAGTDETFRQMADKLKVKVELICQNCQHVYEWPRDHA